MNSKKEDIILQVNPKEDTNTCNKKPPPYIQEQNQGQAKPSTGNTLSNNVLQPCNTHPQRRNHPKANCTSTITQQRPKGTIVLFAYKCYTKKQAHVPKKPSKKYFKGSPNTLMFKIHLHFLKCINIRINIYEDY